MNLYSFVQNVAVTSSDLLGLHEISVLVDYITLEVRTDSSLSNDSRYWTSQEKLTYESNFSRLKDALKCCCIKWPETCVMLDVMPTGQNIDPNEPDKYTRENYVNFSKKAQNGNIPVLLTSKTVVDESVGGLGMSNRGIIVHMPSSVRVDEIAHELGHVGGYGTAAFPHAQSQDNLMSEQGGDNVDEQWCKKVKGLSVKRKVVLHTHPF